MADTRLLVASRNKKKLRELRRVLDSAGISGIELVGLDEVPEFPEAPETAATFEENALAKARDGAAATGLPCVADDSGLEVDALEGAPGVHSARYAATANHPGNSLDEKNNAKLLAELKGRAPHHRAARFRCVLALARAGQYSQPQLFIGTCEGRIDEAPHGEHGFGYDPLFIPDVSGGDGRTFAQMSPEEKGRSSHRTRAYEQLVLQIG